MMKIGMAMAAVDMALMGTAAAEPITDPSFFDDVNATTIDFEQFPQGTLLTDQYAGLGLLLSSEDEPNTLQTTDPADAAGRFEASCRVLPGVVGGGDPTSGINYVGGDTFNGLNTSDMRLDFVVPVTAFGMFFIDNDFSNVRVTAYNEVGDALESVLVLEVGEGGVTYTGLFVTEHLSYVIIDANNGEPLDSTFIDDLSFADVEPCPADLDGDDMVGIGDFLLVLAQWGPCPPKCIADVDGDGEVGIVDLLIVLASWGRC